MICWFLVFLLSCTFSLAATPPGRHDLSFDDLPTRWDEAIPLGNGMLGVLVWQEGDILRFSLDRADLWDLRPVTNFQKPEFSFRWMYDHITKGDIGPIRKLIEYPYDKLPAPTKIPAGRLEFDQSQFGEVRRAWLNLETAVCVVNWESGVQLQTFVHATEPVGWFKISGVKSGTGPRIIPPPFGGEEEVERGRVSSLSGHDLRSLGYPAPRLESGENSRFYEQEGWGGFKFAIYCAWRPRENRILEGAWSISSTESAPNPLQRAKQSVQEALERSSKTDFATHAQWWKTYWNRSGIAVPDEVIESQWYREMYKFGSVARRGAPPISLQAVWTADERRIPPWKGDFHHDLNTELSYWPCYTANHLEEGLSFLDWLWEVKPMAKAWTRKFYGLNGLNFPGMTTLRGEPIGGWHQYSCSPTTSAWLAHHFCLHWRYSMDRRFLENRAYPWIRDVAVFLDEHSVRREDGKRKLPLSSSPEINDNRLDAWFPEPTNYDLSLIRWLYGAAAELAGELGLDEEAEKWSRILSEWPDLARSQDDGRLLVAAGEPLRESHRHFSHLMAIHPLGLVDWDNGESDRQTILSSLEELERLGPSLWCGYSYAWFGCLAARARDGDRAAEALRTFALCFCSPNTFHLNGDQTKSGKSNFTYRPFTLEGNFAFAAAVQEMLVQSHTGVIRLFPAVPETWRNAAFESLRAEGAFLVSATMRDGEVQRVAALSEKGETLHLASPFGEDKCRIYGVQEKDVRLADGVFHIKTKPDQEIWLERIKKSS